MRADCAFDEAFACARAVCNSASAYLVVCIFNSLTNSLIALWAYVEGLSETEVIDDICV